jgi:hypothetical protein
MKRFPDEMHTQTHGSLTEIFWQSQIVFLDQKRVNKYMWTHGKDGAMFYLVVITWNEIVLVVSDSRKYSSLNTVCKI